MITVKQLKDILEKYPPSMRVVVCGYEGGISDLLEGRKMPIKLNQNRAWYYGPHKQCNVNESANENALYLAKEPNPNKDTE